MKLFWGVNGAKALISANFQGWLVPHPQNCRDYCAQCGHTHFSAIYRSKCPQNSSWDPAPRGKGHKVSMLEIPLKSTGLLVIVELSDPQNSPTPWVCMISDFVDNTLNPIYSSLWGPWEIARNRNTSNFSEVYHFFKTFSIMIDYTLDLFQVLLLSSYAEDLYW